MKKTIVSLLFAGASLTYHAQTSPLWSTNLNAGPGFKLGLSTPDELDFYTNNVPVMSLSNDGQLLLNGLADPHATDPRAVYVDPQGNLRTWTGPGSNGHDACVQYTLPWYEGGNTGSTYNTIGTCDNRDFILKANNQQSIFIKPSAFVGVGLNNNSPQSALDVSDGSIGVISAATDHTKIYGNQDGRIEATWDLNLASSNVLNTTCGKSTNLIFNTSNIGTSAFAIHAGGYVPGTTEKFIIKANGYVGIGTASPGVKVDISDPAAVALRVLTTSYNDAAKITVANAWLGYDFSVDNAAIGHISGPGSNILNFRNTGSSPIIPQVWIGNAAGAPNTAQLNINCDNNANSIEVYNSNAATPANKVVFRVKNSGAVYAQEIFVQIANYPDYVFKKDYKLMSLENIETYIQKNHHLPNVPSATEIEKNGANLGDLSKIQMEKIEELMLYIIQLKKEIETIKEKIKQ